MSGTRMAADPQTLLAQREWVRRVARALAADANAADDLEQDLWVGLLERPPRPRSSLRGWIAAALRHRLLNVKRADARRARHELAASRAEAVVPRQVVEEADAHRRVVNLVMGLDEPYRTAVLLRFFEDLAPGAIARQLGVPTETVRTRIRRALAMLRDELSGSSGADRLACCLALAPLLRTPATTSGGVGAAATVGGIATMGKAVLAAAGAAVLVVGGTIGWVASRNGLDDRLRSAEGAAEAARRQAEALAADVARLRDAVGVARSNRLSAESASPTPHTTLRSAVDDHATRLAALEQSIAGRSPDPAFASAPPGDSSGLVGRGRQVLAELQANRDGTRVAAIRAALQEFVRIGDPIVPEIAAVLDSGLDTRYRDDRPLMQHLHGYDGVRMVLNESLREIGTSSARKALFESARKSGRPSDFRDLVYNSASTTDPDLIEGISALVPDMLRSLARSGIKGTDGDTIDLAWGVSSWIRKRAPSGVVEPLAEVVRKAPADTETIAWMAYEGLLGVLLELAPDEAGRVVLEVQGRQSKPTQQSPFTWGFEGRASRTALVGFYNVLLSRTDMRPDERFLLYRGMPSRSDHDIKDPAKRAEDAQVFVTFLEERLRVESDERTRREITEKLEAFRKDLEKDGR